MKYYRIKKNEQFSKLFKRGKRAYSQALTVIYMPARVTSMGVAVSKKHGKAVRRNRIKRLARQAFYNTMETLNGCYSVIILPKVAEDYSLKLFEKSLTACFKKVNSCGNEQNNK